MHVQIITFGLKGLGDEEYRSHCEAIAPAFAQLPGLVSKAWLANAETNTYGGVYLWRDRRSMESYGRSDIYGGCSQTPTSKGWPPGAFPSSRRPRRSPRTWAARRGPRPGRVSSTR